MLICNTKSKYQYPFKKNKHNKNEFFRYNKKMKAIKFHMIFIQQKALINSMIFNIYIQIE